MLTTLKLGWQKAILPIQNIFMPQLEFCAISFGKVHFYVSQCHGSAVLGPQDTPDTGTRQLFSEATSQVQSLAGDQGCQQNNFCFTQHQLS